MRTQTHHTNQIDMLHGPLLGKILLFALPLAASSILQQLFNSADVAVAGRFAGYQAQAAVGVNSPVINLLINLFVGLSVGGNVVIANFIGQRKDKEIQDAVHTVITLALISGAFLLCLGQVAARPILTVMGTPEDVLDLSVLYLRIYFLGMPFIMVYNFGSAILRSVGDTRRPLYCLTLAGVINVCLNLLFVIVFHRSADGVAIATVNSNGVSAGLVIFFLLREEEEIRLYPKKLRMNKDILGRVVRIGVPAGIQGMVFSLSNVCIQSAINSFGSDAMAGSAAAQNFESFTFFVTNSFNQATVTFVSQNYGAHQFDRCKKILRLSLAAGFLCTGAMCAMFVLGRNTFIRLFTIEPAVIDYALIRMTHIATFSWLAVSYEVTGAALRGVGYSLTPAIITVFGSCILRLIWVFVLFPNTDSFGRLMYVYPITWLVTGVMMFTAYFILRKRVYHKDALSR